MWGLVAKHSFAVMAWEPQEMCISCQARHCQHLVRSLRRELIDGATMSILRIAEVVLSVLRHISIASRFAIS